MKTVVADILLKDFKKLVLQNFVDAFLWNSKRFTGDTLYGIDLEKFMAGYLEWLYSLEDNRTIQNLSPGLAFLRNLQGSSEKR